MSGITNGNAIRKFYEAAKDLEIFEPVVLLNTEKFTLKARVKISELSVIAGGLGLYVGNFVHIASQCTISGGGYCILGDFVGVCSGTRIITGTDDTRGEGIPSPMVPPRFRSFYRSYVICETHAFLGTGCIIHPGVTIGEGTVVASGSVVTKSLEPWGVYMGAPAKRVKNRPKEKILEFSRQVYEETGIVPSDFSDAVKAALKLSKTR